MCGRYILISAPDALGVHFGLACLENFPARYNIAPTQPVLGMRQGRGGPEFVLMRWGLIPAWAKEVSSRPLINARAETICEKASFKHAFRRRRCLIPTDGFYEWRTQKGRKQPYLIRRKDKAPFAFAAIWESWMSPDGAEIETVAIVTVEANADMAPIHHRMPAILLPEAYDVWLDHRTEDVTEAIGLLRPYPNGLLEAVPVGDRVNKATNEGADLVAPVDAAAPPGRQGAFDF
ncbi:MAG: SOS response-associated peptidase [Pseudomonadota bacterium]